AVTLCDSIALPSKEARIVLAIVRVAYAEGGAEDYVLPLTMIEGDAAKRLRATRPHLAMADVRCSAAPPSNGLLCDALGDDSALHVILALVASAATVGTSRGLLRFRPFA